MEEFFRLRSHASDDAVTRRKGTMVVTRSATKAAASAAAPADDDVRELSEYMRLWAAANILRVVSGFAPGTALVGASMDWSAATRLPFQPVFALIALFAAAGAFPHKCAGVLPGAALLARAASNLRKGSYAANSQIWATQMDTALLLALLAQFCSGAGPVARRLAQPLAPADERAIVRACGRTVRWQLAIFYLASGFWKINSSFLDPKYSCASIFTVQVLEYMPDALLFGVAGVAQLARAIALTGPAATLVIEGVVPALHALPPRAWPRCARVGVAATLAFHFVIGITPPPSNVSSFGVTTCTRLFFFLPRASAQACAEARRLATSPWLPAVMVAAAAASSAMVAPLHAVAPSTVQGSGTDVHLPYYAALTVLFCRAMVLEPSAPAGASGGDDDEEPARLGGGQRAMVAVALLYAFALPVVGLQEKGGCLMFSQLRLHGGSNHYLLPTSLLQRALLDARPDNAFAGGVVRVEATNLTWVGNTFAEHMHPRTQRVIRELAGVPGEYIWSAKATTAPRATPPPRFMPHTLSALGLRRLIAAALAQGDVFWLEYAKLPGAIGDEAWRTTAAAARFRVEVTGGQVARCEEKETGKPCDARERALLDPPSAPTDALAYFLIPQPNPIVEGLTDEMHCVTWG